MWERVIVFLRFISHSLYGEKCNSSMTDISDYATESVTVWWTDCSKGNEACSDDGLWLLFKWECVQDGVYGIHGTTTALLLLLLLLQCVLMIRAQRWTENHSPSQNRNWPGIFLGGAWRVWAVTLPSQLGLLGRLVSSLYGSGVEPQPKTGIGAFGTCKNTSDGNKINIFDIFPAHI